MTKLNDTQLVLLTSASKRDSGNILPFPDSLTSKPPQIRTAIARLIDCGLVDEVEVPISEPCWREEDERRLGLILNDAGRSAIGLIAPAEIPQQEELDSKPVKKSEIREGTKQALLLRLIQREHGATNAQIREATGWLSHTARAAITGLRKRGISIEIETLEGTSRYRCIEAAAQ